MPVQEKILVWWHARSDRERKILLAWSVSAALLLLWFGLLSPLFQRIATLEKRVPQLEAQLNRMHLRPVDAPRAANTARPAGEDLRSTLYGLLAERKLSAELRALSNSRVEMRLPELPVKEALEVLDSLRQEAGARVAVFNVRTEVASGSASGMSRIVVELERAP